MSEEALDQSDSAVEETVEISEEINEAGDSTKEDIEAIPTNAYPCPTCGMLFSDPDICDTHAGFCAGDAEPSSTVDWNEERIYLLLDCMDVRYRRFTNMSSKEKRNHWKRVGHIVGCSPDEARQRWNMLTASYNRIQVSRMQGRGMAADRWTYYERMHNILGVRSHGKRPDFVISSVPLQTTDADGEIQTDSGVLMPPEEEVGEVGSHAKLINIMEERYPKYLKMPPSKRKQTWREVGEMMGLTANEVRIRWNMLVGSFRRIKQGSKMTRTGRWKKRWRHYDQMERILKNCPGRTPLLVLSGERPLAPRAPGQVFATLQTAAGAQTGLITSLSGSPTKGAAGATILPVLQLGQSGVLQATTVPTAAAGATATTVAGTATTEFPSVLQSSDGRPMEPRQASAEIEAFANKRKALFVEDYLRGKARREELRLQLEERRIRALERLADAMEARNSQ